MLQREEIYQRVWGYAMVHGDRSVDVFVRKLRQKLERASPGWRYIHTHFGIGYRFAAEPVEAGGRARPSRPARSPSRPSAADGAGRRAAPEPRSALSLSAVGSGPRQAPAQHRDHRRARARRLEAAGRRHGQPDDQQPADRSSSSAACCSSATGCTWSTARRSSGSTSASAGSSTRALALGHHHARRHAPHVGRGRPRRDALARVPRRCRSGRSTASGAPTASTDGLT